MKRPMGIHRWFNRVSFVPGSLRMCWDFSDLWIPLEAAGTMDRYIDRGNAILWVLRVMSDPDPTGTVPCSLMIPASGA